MIGIAPIGSRLLCNQSMHFCWLKWSGVVFFDRWCCSSAKKTVSRAHTGLPYFKDKWQKKIWNTQKQLRRINHCQTQPKQQFLLLKHVPKNSDEIIIDLTWVGVTRVPFNQFKLQLQISGWSQVICLVPGICAEPGGIPHHHRVRYNGPYHAGSKVVYRCHKRKDCQSDGTWKSTTAVCTGEIEAKSDENMQKTVFALSWKWSDPITAFSWIVRSYNIVLQATTHYSSHLWKT